VAAASGDPSASGNLVDRRLVEAAIKEPISFWGGVFAGFLALDLQQGKFLFLRMNCALKITLVVLLLIVRLLSPFALLQTRSAAGCSKRQQTRGCNTKQQLNGLNVRGGARQALDDFCGSARELLSCLCKSHSQLPTLFGGCRPTLEDQRGQLLSEWWECQQEMQQWAPHQPLKAQVAAAVPFSAAAAAAADAAAAASCTAFCFFSST
jgi:hypothetical protein